MHKPIIALFFSILICLSVIIWRRRNGLDLFSSMSVKTLRPAQQWQLTMAKLADPAAVQPGGLPSLTRVSAIDIKPEKIAPPPTNTTVYFSLLTAPKYHDSRFSIQYLTWLQSVNPHHVGVVTDNADNQWIQAFREEGGNIYLPPCPIHKTKTRKMMCCKTGAQFDYWYKAKEKNPEIKWYCHVDDDLYMNAKALYDMLSQYDPMKDWYIGAWTCIQKKVYRIDRIKASIFAPGLLNKFPERKNDDFRYANGPSYCISEALMFKVEKYLRGRNFEDTCVKADVKMDDFLSGAIIDGVLGINLTVNDDFMSQWDDVYHGTDEQLKKKITLGSGMFVMNDSRFWPNTADKSGFLSYHCLLNPRVSWCKG